MYAQATADAPAGIHRFATEDALIARTLGSSLYDSARALLDRLSVDGAFEVGDYEGVQEHLARARTPYPSDAALRDARAAILDLVPIRRFVLVVDEDAETSERSLLVTAYAEAAPEAASEAAWAFYAGWLAEHRDIAETISFSIRSV